MATVQYLTSLNETKSVDWVLPDDNFLISVKHEVQVHTLKQNNIQSLFCTDINLWLLRAQNLKFFKSGDMFPYFHLLQQYIKLLVLCADCQEQ
jgi:hypothetical protein